MLSSIFNIKQINVTNNSKITSQEIINLSTLQTGVNMFKTTNTQGSDPSMKMMPIMMSVIIIITAFFMPSALGIYWSVGNIFAIVQNVVVKRGMEKHGK